MDPSSSNSKGVFEALVRSCAESVNQHGKTCERSLDMGVVLMDDGDHVRLDLAIDGALTELRRYAGGGGAVALTRSGLPRASISLRRGVPWQ